MQFCIIFQELGVCDYSYNVDCRGTPTGVPPLTTQPPSSVPPTQPGELSTDNNYVPWQKFSNSKFNKCL